MKLEHLLQLLPRLRERDRYEVMGVTRQADMTAWAYERSLARGVHFAVIDNGTVEAVGGALDGVTYDSGALWFVCSEAIRRNLRVIVKIWRAISRHGGYRRLECKCYADNEEARDFAERLGFAYEGTLRAFTSRGEDVIQYGMVIGGYDGRR